MFYVEPEFWNGSNGTLGKLGLWNGGVFPLMWPENAQRPWLDLLQIKA